MTHLHKIPNLFKNASIAILIYAFNNKKSFEDLKIWYDTLQNHSCDSIIFLIGNKSDLEKEKVVPIKDAETFKNNYDDIKMLF